VLRQRIITAVVLALAVVGSILQQDNLWTRILFALVLLAASRELILLNLKLRPAFAAAGAILFAALFWVSGTVMNDLLIYWQSLAGLLLWLLIALAMLFYRHHGNWPLLARVTVLAIGLDLLWICAHGLVYLHRVYGGELLLFVLSLVWVADIGAYFAGRAFGRHKLAPSISPGKTREGLAGGLLANLLWMGLVYHYVGNWGLSAWQFVAVGTLTSLASVIGDLFVSVMKREAGVKDSGKLLPGHGGMLDRIDSVLAASPVYVCGLIMASQL
jgi:phosphatidate cytidylyltransferase